MALNRCFSPSLAIKLERPRLEVSLLVDGLRDAARSRLGLYGAESEHDKEPINCSITDLRARYMSCIFAGGFIVAHGFP